MPLYVAHFVVLQQDVWYSKAEPHKVARQSEKHRLVSLLFEAASADAAYEKTSAMVNGLSDAHCDGEGDRTNYYGVGIRELEEVFVGTRPFGEVLNGPYGLEVGNIEWSSEAPEVRLREELSVFSQSRGA